MKKIIVWTNKREKDRLEKLNRDYNFDIVFVDTFEEFSSRIRDDVVFLMLRRKANNFYRKLLRLAEENRDRIIYSYITKDDRWVMNRETSFAGEKNVITFGITELFNKLKMLI